MRVVRPRWIAGGCSAPEREDAKVIFVCHSMGGLVARWYLDSLRRGAAHADSLHARHAAPRVREAVGELVNGVRKAGVDLSAFARSMPSSYELLPEYACIEAPGALLKTTETELPGWTPEVADAMAFHNELDAVEAVVLAHLGHRHRAADLHDRGRRRGARGAATHDRRGDHSGDGTVPRLAARPKRVEDERDTGSAGSAKATARSRSTARCSTRSSSS